MPITEEQKKNIIEFSPIGNRYQSTNTPETIKDDSQRHSHEENVIHREDWCDGRNETREKEETTAVTEICKTFGAVSMITTETKKDKEEAKQETAASQDKRARETKTTTCDLGGLITKLNEIDKKLKCCEEDRQELKKKKWHNKNENLDNYYALARATEEMLQHMWNIIETTDKEREKHIKKDMREKMKRYDTVNEKL